MSNELQMIKLLVERELAGQIDEDEKPAFGYHGRIDDLCHTMVNRLLDGDHSVIPEIAEVQLFIEATAKTIADTSQQIRCQQSTFVFDRVFAMNQEYQPALKAARLQAKLRKPVEAR